MGGHGVVSLLGGGRDKVHFFALEGFVALGRVAGVIVGVCTVVCAIVLVVVVICAVVLVAASSRVIIW